MMRGMKSGKRETKELHNCFRMTHEVVPSGLINLGMSVHKPCSVLRDQNAGRPDCRDRFVTKTREEPLLTRGVRLLSSEGPSAMR